MTKLIQGEAALYWHVLKPSDYVDSMLPVRNW